MLNLPSFPQVLLAKVARDLSPKEIGSLSNTSKLIKLNLGYETRFAAVLDDDPSRSDEDCHTLVIKLSQYADQLTEGFEGKATEEVQHYASVQHAQLVDELEHVESDKNDALTCVVQRRAAAVAAWSEDQKCDSESKKQLGLQSYNEHQQSIQEDGANIVANARLSTQIVRSKIMLLSLERIIQTIKADPNSSLTEIPYEKELIDWFHERIDTEVASHGKECWVRAKDQAEARVNCRQYLVPFTSSPDTIFPYLNQLKNDLIAESNAKHFPRTFAGCCTIF